MIEAIFIAVIAALIVATAFSVRQTVATEAASAATAKPRLIVDRVEGEQIAGAATRRLGGR